MIFLAQEQAPRVPQELSTYTVDEHFPGFTCTTIYEPGILVLVESLPDDTSQPENSSILSDGCDVTTLYIINLRAEPDLDGEVLAELPHSQTYPALDHVPGWYRISVDGVEGWVSDACVSAEDDCPAQ
ncbi:SH3 domain-containing protein [Aggregatilinea lenta]|uniref:SH3 domain-containing protein n=1 Tax=Aggregatilinea lenta TaxID=913108 RepID=UPI000E5BA9C1|nr:SH3 domain-containing protein [Aggregatilinea lenta]